MVARLVRIEKVRGSIPLSSTLDTRVSATGFFRRGSEGPFFALGAPRLFLTSMDRPAVRDGALLVLRLILGVIFVSHGWDKIFITGVDKTTGYFVAAGIPQAEITVWLVAIVELVGGALLILGLLAPAVAMVLVVTMLGALWAVHLGNGLFMRDDGAELVLSLIGGLIVVWAFGAGRASLDRMFTA